MLTAQAAGDLDSHQGRTCGANAEAIANRALFIRPPLAKPYQASVPFSGLVPAYSQATVSDLPIVGKNFLQSTLSGSSFGSVSVPTVFSSTVLSLSIDAAEMDEFSFSASVLVVLGSFFGSASVSTVFSTAVGQDPVGVLSVTVTLPYQSTCKWRRLLPRQALTAYGALVRVNSIWS